MSKRKVYKHNPDRKYDHPLMKKAEAAAIGKWWETHEALIDGFADGSYQESTMVTLADVIAPAIKSMEGWEDPDDIGGVMVDAMGALQAMALNGYKWDHSHNALLKDAVNCAIQVSAGMPVLEIAKAIYWARSIRQKVMMEAA